MYEKVKKLNRVSLLSDNQILIIAGPCAVESEEQLTKIARFLQSEGIHYMRAGAYKPRTSPYTFQGLEEEGLEILKKVKEKTGIKIVTEIMDATQIPFYEQYVDIIQIGARNMQNFALLKKLGKIKCPILLKRAFAATIDEWLYACEYIAKEGNDQIILCERGIRTFETRTRTTLDIASTPIVQQLTKLPILIDPSHSSGRSDIILPLARAAIAVGADGIMVEVHDDPKMALSDQDETINFEQFHLLMKEIRQLAKLYNKEII